MVIDPPPARPRLRRAGWLHELLDTALLIVFVYTLVNLATTRYFIDGPSMQPSFYTGQYVLVSRVPYLVGEPQRGDIVVFNTPGARYDDPSLIKRLIGLPGETVTIRDGQVFVDGIILDEPYIKEECQQNRCRDAEWALGADEFFLMGDNRNNSNDSRYFGPVPRSNLVGEALVRYWPPSDWGVITRFRFP
ncbi:MAG: signal peptidase I [Anaerolineae bacterium]|nr:signal peptidase I [Anaerolineae bacterium]